MHQVFDYVSTESPVVTSVFVSRQVGVLSGIFCVKNKKKH